MFGATDWALKRLFKFVLKRNLKHLIATEIDLEQLTVQLGNGVLELKEILLSTDYLNEHLRGIPLRVTEALVGGVRAVIPFTALYSDTCTVSLDEVLLTLEPCAVGSQPAAATAAGPNGTDLESDAVSSQSLGPEKIAEGVKFIAGGIESLLRRLQIQATSITVHVVLPPVEESARGGAHAGGRLVVNVSQFGYSSKPELSTPGAVAPGESSSVRLGKQISFQGLSAGLELGVGTSATTQTHGAASSLVLLHGPDGGGCSADATLRLVWNTAGQERPHVNTVIAIGPLQIHLGSEHVLAMHTLVSHLVRSKQAAQPAVEGSHAPPAPVHPEDWGSRSLLESLMLPDCEGLALQALTQGDATEEGEVSEDDEFFDAKSFMDSIHSVFSAGSTSGSGVMSPVDSPGSAQITLSRMQSLTASVRQKRPPLEWGVELSCASCSVTLDICPALRSQEADTTSPGGKLWLELTSVRVVIEAKGRIWTAAVSVHQLCVAECLPLGGCCDEGRAGNQSTHAAMVGVAGIPSTASADSIFVMPAVAGVHPSLGSAGVNRTVEQLNDLHDRSLPFLRQTAVHWGIQPLVSCTSSAAENQVPALIALLESGDSAHGEFPMAHVAMRPLSLWAELETLERLQHLVWSIGDRMAWGGSSGQWHRAEASGELPTVPQSSGQAEAGRSDTEARSVHGTVNVFVAAVSIVVPFPTVGGDGSGRRHLAAYLSTGNHEADTLLESLDEGLSLPLLKSSFRELASKDAMLRAKQLEREHDMIWRCELESRRMEVHFGEVEVNADMDSSTSTSQTVMTLEGDPGDCGILVQVDVGPSFHAMPALQDVWDEAENRQQMAGSSSGGKSLEQSTAVLEAAERSSGTLIRIRVPAATLSVTSGTIGCVLSLWDKFSQLLPQPLTQSARAPQTTARLLCEKLQMTLVEGDDNGVAPDFTAVASSLGVRSIGSLCGCQGASATLLSLDSLCIRNSRREVLLVASSTVDTARTLRIQHLTRPRAGTVASRSNRIVFPTYAMFTSQLRDCTLSMERGDLSLAWITRLGALLRRGSSSGVEDPSQCVLGFGIHVSDCAVRAEPPQPSSEHDVAVALTVSEAGVWQQAAAEAGVSYSMARAALYLVHLATREGGWEDLTVQRQLAPRVLEAAGYTAAVSESALMVHVPHKSDEGASILINSRRLTATVSQHTASLVMRVAAWMQARMAASAPPPPPPWPAGGGSERGTDVLADIQQNEFLQASASDPRPVTTSIFVGGGSYEDVPDSPLSPAGSPPVLLEAVWDEMQVGEEGRHRNEGDGTWLWPATDVLDDYVEVPAPEGQPPPDAALCRKLTLTSNLVLVFLTRSNYRLELCLNGAEVCMGVPDSGDIRRSYMLTVPEASLRDGRNRRVLGRFLLPDAMLPGPQLRLVVDAVAGAGVDDEYRISVDCAPVRLSLWQDTVEGLQDLSAQLTDPSSFETDFAAELVEWEGDDAAEDAASSIAARGGGDGGLFVQRFELAPWVLVLDYRPRRVDLAALRAGSAQELLNLVPFGGVKLRFRRLRVLASEGVGALLAAVAAAYLDEMVRQAGKFVKGAAPIRPLVRAAGAVRDLLPSTVVPGAQAAATRSRIMREVGQGVRVLVAAIVSEALAAADSAAGATAAALESQPQAAAAAEAVQRRVQSARVKMQAPSQSPRQA